MKFFGEISAADWLRPSAAVLVLANLVPAFGVIFLGWQVFPLMFLFWSENVIVGVFNVLKMLVANPESPKSGVDKLSQPQNIFSDHKTSSKPAITKRRTGIKSVAELLRQSRKSVLIPFFCVHYGVATSLHGVFVIGFFGGGFKHGAGFPGWETLWHTMQENHLGWAILGLAISRGISFTTNYLGNGEYKRASLQQLMQQPYGRVFVLHMAVLGGGILMQALHSPLVGLLLLVALKIAFDLRGHLAERKKFAGNVSG